MPAFYKCLLFDSYSGQVLGVFLSLIPIIKTGASGPPDLAKALGARVASVVPFLACLLFAFECPYCLAAVH